MERVGKYCLALRKMYEQEGINSSHSGAIRKKLRRMLFELDDSDENAQVLELYWKTAYYEPLMKLRKQKVCIVIATLCMIAANHSKHLALKGEPLNVTSKTIGIQK
ncbi:unnamed protein product [Strongylus vulgaris]|uniref:Uncharacterized protein n=1 Tax=Strongylus vulgaris TaxID=40348 RepID=A0A3P7J9K8_STRVU|nr:unnamed protein product [Strongylus vulgaris]